MKKIIDKFKTLINILYKYFPIVGGYSVNDIDELNKDPENYEYRDNSYAKKKHDSLMKQLDKDKDDKEF